MAKSSALIAAVAAVLLAGTFALAHAQGAGGGPGSASTPGATNPGTPPNAADTNPNSLANRPGANLNNPTGGPGATGGGNHRQPKRSDRRAKRKQGYMPNENEKDIDRKIGSICRGC